MKGSCGCIISFNTEQDNVDRANASRIVGNRGRADDAIPKRATNLKAVGAYGGEVSAARDERNIDASLRETTAKVTAQTACAHNANFHGRRPIRQDGKLCGNTLG
jgi:hypothetical protein